MISYQTHPLPTVFQCLKAFENTHFLTPYKACPNRCFCCPYPPTPTRVEIWELGNPEIWDFAPLGLCSKNEGFRTACLITGQKFQGVGLKLTAFILTFRDPSSHLCQKIMRVAVLTDLELGSCSRIWDFSNLLFEGI